MPDATELVTLSEVKSYLQITTESFDDILEAIKASVEQFVKSYCHDPFLNQEYTEYFDGDGGKELLVANYPITEIVSIHIDSERVFGDDTEVDLDDVIESDAHNKRGLVELFEGSFTDGRKNIKVVYKAGYPTIPEDIKHAVKALCAREYLLQDKQMIGVTSQNVADKTVSLNLEDIPRNVFLTLQAYRRPFV